MPRKVKRAGPARPGRGATTRISSKPQVTIPVAALRSAGFRPGDTVQVEAKGAGQVLLTRVDELVARHAGALDTGGKLRRDVDALRDEWR
jgi:bifunctional DNA-binding transcriptional regulator/antitoxin component of YhaV-PrlF toxin-antitoxin module